MNISKSKPQDTPAMTAIARGTTFTGNIESNNPIRIDGVLIGNINSHGKLVIGPEASIKGDIQANDIIISGSITGNINAKNSVILQPESTINGDIRSEEITMEAGSTFNGSCAMGKEIPTVQLKAKQA